VNPVLLIAALLSAAGTVSADTAAEEVARGRAELERRTRVGLESGLEAFERATRLAPRSAPAWAGLAEAASLIGLYGFRAPDETLPRARDAAQRALALDPELPAAHAARGLALYLYDRDYAAAEAAFVRSIELDPGAAEVRHWLGMLLLATGRPAEAAASMDAALARDPDSLIVGVKRGTVLAGAARTAEAELQLRSAVERHPRLSLAWRELGYFELGRAELGAAVLAFERAREIDGSAKASAALASLYGRLGREAEARQLLEQIQAEAATGWVPPLSLALVHAGLGESDAAFERIDEAFDVHDPGLVYLGVKPGWEPLHPDPRWARALRRAGLPAPALAARSGPAAAGTPNILLILADDVGYGDLSCYGASAVQTPNLDRLAAHGIRFTSAHAAASTCTPSRYSLLTGEYAFRNREAVILPGNAPLIVDPAKPTLASLLKAQGYATGLVGKWHLGLGEAGRALDWNGEIRPGPRELGFDYSFHMAATGDRVPTVYIENGRIVGLDPEDPVEVSYGAPVGGDPTGLSHPELLRVQADEQHSATIVDGTSRIGYMSGGRAARWVDEELPDTFLRKAVDFIEVSRGRPFFLYYATHENHVPRLPHPRFRGSSGLGVRGDAVVQMDWGVGVLLETLERHGLLENTLVVFTSDNGPVLYDGYYDGAFERNGSHRPSGPWRGGKYSAWEGGTRVPFIVSWPGAVRPGLSSALIGQVDLLASFAALTGALVPEGAARDSRNLIDTLTGRSPLGRDRLVEQGVGLPALRLGDWKYLPPGEVSNRGGIGAFVRDVIAEPGALYYLPEDPSEQKDLASLYPARVEEMRALLEAELGHGIPAPGTRSGLGGADEH